MVLTKGFGNPEEDRWAPAGEEEEEVESAK